MNIRFDSLSLLPSLGQQSLIKTILSEDKESCLNYWQQWKRYQDFESLDYESFILLPFLLKKIEQFEIIDENIPRYQGIMKKNWVENQQQKEVIDTIIHRFKNSKIPFFLYDENAIDERLSQLKHSIKRSRISLLIQNNDLQKCTEVLKKTGWKITENSFYQKHFSKINFIQFIKEKTRLTLYFHPTRIPLNSTFENSIFTLKSETKIPLIINDTAYIYLLLLRSQSEYYIAKITWIIFCYHIQKQNNNIDWLQFIKIVQTNNSSLFILPAFKVLNSLNPEAFPNFVIEALNSKNSKLFTKLEYKLIASKGKLQRKIYYGFLYPIKKQAFHFKYEAVN